MEEFKTLRQRRGFKDRLIDILELEGWLTEQTYGKNFSRIPSLSGVYIVITQNIDSQNKEDFGSVMYVGMSKNLKKGENHTI